MCVRRRGGAGHNGLTCAAYLAQAGQKVLVLEAHDTGFHNQLLRAKVIWK